LKVPAFARSVARETAASYPPSSVVVQAQAVRTAFPHSPRPSCHAMLHSKRGHHLHLLPLQNIVGEGCFCG
jgi:hypothetical protein